MKDKILSIIDIAIDITFLVSVIFICFSGAKEVFSENTMHGILLTLGGNVLCIIGALVLSKDITKAGDIFGR